MDYILVELDAAKADAAFWRNTYDKRDSLIGWLTLVALFGLWQIAQLIISLIQFVGEWLA